MSKAVMIERYRSNGHGHIATVLPGPWPQVVAIVPAYNEERFIGSVVLKTKQYVDTVIVIDDGSSDATAEIAEAAGAIVVRHRRNQGKGHALNTGFQRARELAPQAMVLMDRTG